MGGLVLGDSSVLGSGDFSEARTLEMDKIEIKRNRERGLVIGDWLWVIGPLTPPPTFAGSPPGTGAWVLAHPRNGDG